MTVRFVATALQGEPELPPLREGGLPEGLLPACVVGSQAGDALQKLREPDVLLVTTGQQPALFTGPLYTIYKALSAAALARVLERRWERPVVPVFWSAGDDHDFAEANHVAWIAEDGSVATGTLRSRAPDAPLTPLYREPVGEEVHEVLTALGAALPASEFRDATLDWLARSFRPGATLAAAFTAALAELLAPAGVVVLDSTHPAVKRAAARHLVRALGLARDLDRELAMRARELVAAGLDAGVAAGDGATLVMLEGVAGRDRLVLDGSDYVTRRGRERFSLAQLQTIAAERPERLSANVLLRPVIESALLPTVAYVAGPGELRYLNLTPPVYERMRVPRQLPVARWSGTIVERRVDRVLEKFGLELDELLEPAGALEGRLVRAQLPEEALAALSRLRAAIDEQYATIGRAAEAVDPTLAKPVQGARQQALTGSQDIEKKLVQHLKRRQGTELGQLARARASVLPEGKPQERVLTIAPLLARYGPGLITELAETIHGWYANALEGPPVPA